MLTHSKTRFTIMIAIVVICMGMIASQAVAAGSSGTISGQLGLSMASEQAFGSTSNGKTQTTLSFGADYKYPIGDRFRVGASLLSWKFDAVDDSLPFHGGTSFCAQAGYLMGSKRNQEVYLGVGSDIVRVGLRRYANEDTPEQGMYYSLEFVGVIKDDSDVNSFMGLAVGYSF